MQPLHHLSLNLSFSERKRNAQGIDDVDAATRAMSCTALGHLFEASGDRNEMFRSKTQWAIRTGIIGKLLPRLCDPNADVAYRALEATRNMLSVGGKVLCDAFMKADVLTQN